MNIDALGFLILGFLGGVILITAVVLYALRRTSNFVGRFFREYIDKG